VIPQLLLPFRWYVLRSFVQRSSGQEMAAALPETDPAALLRGVPAEAVQAMLSVPEVRVTAPRVAQQVAGLLVDPVPLN